MPAATDTSHPDAVARCPWCLGDPLYIQYHDQEWGVPLHDDQRLFELLLLEGVQAGLSWLTVLRRRAHYRRVYAGFDPQRVAAYDAARQAALLADPGIIRNRLKVAAAVTNARAFLQVQARFGSFDAFLWDYVDGLPIQNHWRELKQVPATTALSDRLSRELKRLGFRFVGSTICYAYLQSAGLVNDHLIHCHRHRALAGG